MALKEDIQETLRGFDDASPDRVLELLDRIRAHLRSDLTRDYLAGKIQGVRDAGTEPEKKRLCKNLVPYLDWYLQGS